MERTMVTCGQCKTEQDVTAEAKKVRDSLSPKTFGAFTWKCAKCGAKNQSMVDAPL